MMSTTTKTCQACGKVLRGRIDKKFCGDSCRNQYNNQQRADTTNLARLIIYALRRNRKILETILEDKETAKASKEKLLGSGFLFRYHTHTYETQKGDTYYFCFEMGYLSIDQDRVLIVRRSDRNLL
jgi:hypothetical protein